MDRRSGPRSNSRCRANRSNGAGMDRGNAQARSADTRTYGLPGTAAERKERRRRLMEEHSETLRRLDLFTTAGNKNFQIVLKTTVISGHTGAPQIIAVHTW